MYMHAAVNNNMSIICKSEEAARKYAAEHAGFSYSGYRNWKYYDRYGRNSTTSYASLQGEDIISAIENNIYRLLSNMSMVGAPGYTLHSVSIKYDGGDRATLIVEGWPTSSAQVGFNENTLSPENMRKASMEILDVTPDELDVGTHVFTMRK